MGMLLPVCLIDGSQMAYDLLNLQCSVVNLPTKLCTCTNQCQLHVNQNITQNDTIHQNNYKIITKKNFSNNIRILLYCVLLLLLYVIIICCGQNNASNANCVTRDEDLERGRGWEMITQPTIATPDLRINHPKLTKRKTNKSNWGSTSLWKLDSTTKAFLIGHHNSQPEGKVWRGVAHSVDSISHETWQCR